MSAEAAWLQVVSGVRKGVKIPLAPGRTIDLGRKRGELVLPDPLVSSAHCRITAADGGWKLTDLGSTNGTMVDGRLVREALLRPGSEIVVGSSRILFLVDAPVSRAVEAGGQSGAAAPDIAWLLDEELIAASPKQGSAAPADLLPPDLRLPPGLNAVLQVVQGVDSGRVFRLSRGNVAIGRHQGEVALEDLEVSRYHAVIEMFGRNMLFVRDLGSTNGTFHNARRISVGRLQSGDSIGVGKTILRVEFARAPA